LSLNAMKTLQIVGRKKAGKTRLIVQLIPALRARGWRVATVKHSSHGHELDLPGTDSAQHRRAGAEATLIIAANAVALHRDPPPEPSDREALLQAYLGDFDLVLIEGWSRRDGPRIEVVPALDETAWAEPLHRDHPRLLAVAGGAQGASPPLPAAPPVPWLLAHQIDPIADLIVRALGPDEPPRTGSHPV
jgi:molybdopterin-guanine dinucleotide biosynthesis protein B